MTPEEVPAERNTLIRERLAKYNSSVLDTGSQWGVEEMQAALLAVMDLHGPFYNPQHPSHPWCGGCNDYNHLCPTHQAIAEKLGIEL